MKSAGWLALLIALLLVFAGLHLMAGAKLASPHLVWHALFEYDPHNYQDVVIVRQRLTRLVVALYAGVALSVSGFLLQKVLRNDLVSPSTLGINSGAVTFVVFGIYFFGLGGASLFWPALFGGLAAMTTTFLAAGLVGRGNRDPLTLVLGGAMTATLYAAATTFVISLDPDRFSNQLNWLLGDIGNFDYQPLIILWPVGAVGLVAALLLSRSLDLLSLGGDQAASLGADPRLIQWASLAIAIPLAISSVCIVGPLGFVGLIAPHMARLIIGERGQITLAFCAVLGAMLVVGADIVARTLLAPRLLNVGTVMALCGGLAFLALILLTLRRRPV